MKLLILSCIIVIGFITSCCEPVTSIEWRGETITTDAGKFFYGDHKLTHLTVIEHTDGVTFEYRISFIHARDHIEYTVDVPAIAYIHDSTIPSDLVRFKWVRNKGESNTYMDNATAVHVNVSVKGDPTATFSGSITAAPGTFEIHDHTKDVDSSPIKFEEEESDDPFDRMFKK